MIDDLSWLLIFWGFIFCIVFAEQCFRSARSASDRRRRWPVNIGFALLNGLIASAIPVSTLSAALWAHRSGIGVMSLVSFPAWAEVALLVLARTLAQYGFHRLAHAWPPLWAVHSIHHSDRHLDATSGLRFHPIEVIASGAILIGVSLLLAPPPEMLALFEIVEVLVGGASHTSLPVPHRLDRILSAVLITPGLHHLHHSDEMSEANSNYGALLPVWDMLFGTYLARPLRPPELFRVGVAAIPADKSSRFIWLLEAPFARGGRAGRRAE